MSFIRQRYGKDYYEHIAYRESPDSQRDQNRLQQILAYKNRGNLLEIGCGKGAFLKLAERYFDVTGIDLSRYAIGCLKSRFGAKVRIGDIEEENLAPGHYDVVAVFNVLEHLTRSGLVIQKIYHGLKERGMVIGSVPNNCGLVGTVHTALTNVFDKTHCSTLPPHRWRALFRKAGFQKIDFFGEIMLGRRLSLYVRNRLWPYVSLNLIFVCRR